ncbi:hypothetical protein ACSQ6I_25315 [Anabaena sp. WFMT]|uniref:hypothetical protein n=1 Tax=Anabaena sp. WFMT TaxID=3449730 RepID=UPI003F274A72
MIKFRHKQIFNSVTYCLWLVACSYLLFISPALSKTLTPKTVNPEIGNSCSEQSLETLTTQLLLDLPSYANRATQRARRLSRSVDIFPYVLVAGKPEFQALPLNPGIDTANKYESEGVEQVFFTTFERQYLNQKAVELQQFHWLFLTKTKNGWNVVMMFTRTGEYPVKPPIAAARESSSGAIAQGVKLWLRDCQAGSVRSR